jgi:predicted RNA-binding Zn-ribbon protein involved in translation (DUF1610 family)
MAEIDIGQQWQQLRELYAGMSEDELEAIATRGYELTDIAKQALHAEIARRKLKVVVRLKPPEEEPLPKGDADFDPADLDLKVGWSVENREQAAWVKKTLNDAGIPCYFGPDLLEDVERVKFARDRSVDVLVLRHDQERVRQGLKDFAQKFPSAVYEEPVVNPRCPNCGSTDIMLLGPEIDSSEAEEDEDDEDADDRPEREIEPAAADVSFPWKCEACGYEWRDEESEAES